MAKSVEYLLVTATVGAVMMVAGSMSWAGVAQLAATFAQIAQVLQVNP
jgi:outer membrane murein-binding lipoprotein Lpp